MAAARTEVPADVRVTGTPSETSLVVAPVTTAAISGAGLAPLQLWIGSLRVE